MTLLQTDKTKPTIEVERRLLHPDAQTDKDESNLALFWMKEPFPLSEFIKPIKMAEPGSDIDMFIEWAYSSEIGIWEWLRCVHSKLSEHVAQISKVFESSYWYVFNEWG